MSFARFMATPLGRGARVAVGLVMIAAGIAMGSGGGVVLAIVGLVPLLAGALNVCLIAPLLRAPFKGSDALSARR